MYSSPHNDPTDWPPGHHRPLPPPDSRPSSDAIPLPPGYGGDENRALAKGAEPEDWSAGLTGASGWVSTATQAPQPSPNGGGPSCPDCGGEMWDNTEQRRQQQQEYAAGTREKKPGPAFKCKDRSCGGAVWNAPSQDDIEQQEMSADPGAWEMGHEQHNKDRS